MGCDETVYSACARYHDRSGYFNSEATSELLLGHQRGGSHIDTLVGVNHLQVATSNAFEPLEILLRERTVLAAYLPLMTGTRRSSIMNVCANALDSETTRARTGLTWNEVTTDHELRHCPSCADQQRSELGYSFWRTPHQLPGVWVCLEHGGTLSYVPKRGKRNMNWLSAERAWPRLLHGRVRSEFTERLIRVAACIYWIASNTSINSDVLDAMIRTRFKRAGRIRNEIKVTDTELESLQSQDIAPLIESGASHFKGLSNPIWIRQTIRDRRTAHPVKWAVLLSLYGDCSLSSLAVEHYIALSRLPQIDMFDELSAPRRSKAPEYLYNVMNRPISVREAAVESGMRYSEVSCWLKRDIDLVKHWRNSGYHVKLQAAKFTIEGAIRNSPDAFRSIIINQCLWAVRWLEVHDPNLLKKILPPSIQKFDRQLRLEFK